jgi:hypothetical protein
MATPSASMLLSLVRQRSEGSIKSTRYLAECICLFTGFRNPAELTRQRREKKRPKRKPRHHPALPYAETPQFMPELAGANGGAARSLIFAFTRAAQIISHPSSRALVFAMSF